MIGSGDFLQLSPVPNILYGDFGNLCIEKQKLSHITLN